MTHAHDAPVQRPLVTRRSALSAVGALGAVCGGAAAAAPSAASCPIPAFDHTQQPFSDGSFWNVGLGVLAQWSADGDADTRDLRTPNGYVTAGQYSQPFYIGTSSDPLTLVRCTDTLFPVPDQTIRIPTSATPSQPAGGDQHMNFFDRTQPQWMWSYYGCTRNQDGSITAKLGRKDDATGNQLQSTGYSSGYNFGVGTIRTWEIKAGMIRHMLRCTMNPNRVKSPTSDWRTGLPWPTDGEDYYGPQTYTGNVIYGSTVGIPSTVDLTSVGLTAGGLVLARALQTYGALIRDTNGSPGIEFSAEQNSEGLTGLTQMRSDLPGIM